MTWWKSLILVFKNQMAKAAEKERKTPTSGTPRIKPKPMATAVTAAVSPGGSFHWPSLGDYGFSIAGTTFYQATLKKIAGEHLGKMARVQTVAHLVPDPTNPHDDKAVRIDIRGETVGHLSREDARSFRRRLGAKKLGPIITTCDAEVWGGNVDRNGKKWGYGVKLDIKRFD